MRIGPLEIVIILVVIIAAIVIARISGSSRNSGEQGKESPTDIPAKSVKGGISKVRKFTRRLGLACILAGAVLLFAGASMFRWAFQSYLWSFIIVIIGFALLILSRRK